MPEERISQVVGKAATEPLLPDDPNNARNRRLSIILLRGTGENTAANAQPPSQPAPVDELLPGLNEIKRQQLEGAGGSGGGVTLELIPQIEAQ